MNSSNSLIAIIVHPTEPVTTSGVTAMSPLSISNYLGGAGIFLLLIGMLEMAARATKIRKNNRTEVLEKMWKAGSQEQTGT